MTQFVLMAKHSGELFVGTRVSFMDHDGAQVLENLQGYNIGLVKHDGWGEGIYD